MGWGTNQLFGAFYDQTSVFIGLRLEFDHILTWG